MKIWEKVNNITGNDSKSRYLVPYINAGSKFLLSALPEKFLWTIASETEVNGWDSGDTNNHESLGQGSAIAYDKILAVYRYDGATTTTVSSVDYYRGKKRVAAESPDKNIHIFDEASSLLNATQMFPKFYKLSGKIYIKPDPDYNATDSQQTYTPLGGSSTNIAAKAGDKGVIVYSAPPIIDENTDSWILTEYENIVLFYAASLDHFRLASIYRDLCKDEVDEVVGASGLLSLYRTAVPSYDPTKATDGATTVKIPSKVLSLSISESLPTFSFSGSLPSDFTTAQSLPSSINVSSTLPTFSFNGTLPHPITMATSLPSGISETKSLPSSISIAATLPTDINITQSLPSSFAVAESLPSNISLTSTLPGDFSVAESLPSSFNITQDLPSISELTHVFDTTRVDNALDKAEQLIDGSELSNTTATNAQGWIDDEDVEMAGAVIQTAGVELSRANSSISKEKGKLDDFSAKVGQKMNKYQNDIGKYSQEVNKESSRMKSEVEKYQSAVQREQSKIGSLLNKYEKELQKESQRMQTSTSKYQASVEKESRRVKTDVERYNLEVQKEVSRVQTGLGKYTNQVEKDIKVYQKQIESYASEIQSEATKKGIDISKYEKELAKEVQRAQNELAKYQADLQKSVQTFNSGIQKYSTELSKESARVQSDVSKYQSEVEKESQRVNGGLSKYQAELQKDIQEFGTTLQKYQAALQKSSADLGKDVQQYTLDINNYSSLIQAKSGKFQIDMAKAKSYLEESGTKLQASQIYAGKSQQSIQTSGMFYQRAINELSAITGSITAPEQQQSSQRKEQGAAT